MATAVASRGRVTWTPCIVTWLRQSDANYLPLSFAPYLYHPRPAFFPL
jgi:hypothetical protein